MGKMRKNKQWSCEYCGSTEVNSAFDYKQRFCNSLCYETFRHEKALSDILAGLRLGYSGKTCALSGVLRKHLRETRGTACSVCGWDEKHPIDNRPLTEINHIDGNAKNCSLDNLEILCPNCHSMTYNYRARNKTSARMR